MRERTESGVKVVLGYAQARVLAQQNTATVEGLLSRAVAEHGTAAIQARQSRAEQSRAEQSRAEQSRAEL